MRPSPARIAASLVALTPLFYVGWHVARWALVDARWAVIGDRYRFILFGAYPVPEQWRPAVVCALFAVPFVLTIARARWTRTVVAAWIATEALAAMLMRGGFAGLSEIPLDLWGGLPLTFLLSTVSFTLAMPVAIALAFGRRSAMPAVRALCSAWIELVRGVPLIALLFVASVLVPLCLPEVAVPDKAVRIVVTFAMAVAAYEAEVVGGGIDGVAGAQREAAAALGLSTPQTAVRIVLPQALRAAMPATVNTFIAFFKDTTLVMIVGFFDLLGAAHAATTDGRWAGFGVEVYVFAAVVYGVLCLAIARCGARLERAAPGVPA
jgi:general L-amino acid transport system permease protein